MIKCILFFILGNFVNLLNLFYNFASCHPIIVLKSIYWRKIKKLLLNKYKKKILKKTIKNKSKIAKKKNIKKMSFYYTFFN